MSFGVDYSQAGNGGLIPEGEYEVIIKNAGEDTTKNGVYHLNIPLVIRNDIEQQRKNAYIWHRIWQKKEPTEADMSCGGFSAAQIQTLSKAVGLPNGKQYKDISEWCNDLCGKAVRANVKHEEWKGKTNVRVGYISASKFSECRHVWKTTGSDGDGFQEVDDDGDLPF